MFNTFKLHFDNTVESLHICGFCLRDLKCSSCHYYAVVVTKNIVPQVL